MASATTLQLGYIVVVIIASYLCTVEGTTSCGDQLEQLLFKATEPQLKALDSFGRPEAGFLNAQNTAIWYGHYRECSDLQEYQYCLIDMDVDQVVIPPGIRSDSKIRWGVCVPANCTAEEVDSNINTLLEYLLYNFNANLTNATPSTSCVSDPPLPYSIGFYVTISVAVIILMLMFIGSVVDVLGVGEQDKLMTQHSTDPSTSRQGDQSREDLPLVAGRSSGDSVEPRSEDVDFLIKLKSALRETVLAFSVYRNMAELLNVQEGTRAIPYLHGMRVLSMLWIIVGHVMVPGRPTDLFNTSDVRLSGGIIFQSILWNYYVGVDTFLFLSGVLVCYTTLGKLHRNDGHLKWHWFYIHRYIRLTPLMGALMAINSFVEPHLYDNPDVNLDVSIITAGDGWWANLLYIQNFLRLERRCFLITWYLAVDMQFFLVSPVIILTLYRKPSLGFVQIGILLLVTTGITALLSWQLHTTASLHLSVTEIPGYFTTIYDKPYTRTPPYLFGIIFGYVLYKRGSTGLTISQTMSYLCWAIAVCLVCLVLVPISVVAGTNETIALVIGSGYQALHRFAWSGFLLWVVMSCQYCENGLVNTILSWKAWIPLSRVTYGAYLLHIILLRVFWYNHIQPLYASMLLQTFNFMGVATLAYICAAIVYVGVELPVARLEQRYLTKP